MKVRINYDVTINKTAVIEVDDDAVDEYLNGDPLTDAEMKDFLEAGDPQDWAPLEPFAEPVVGQELLLAEVL